MGEMVLFSGLLVDYGRAHKRYIEPRFIVISLYPTLWAYTRNRQPHQHTHTGITHSTNKHTHTHTTLNW